MVITIKDKKTKIQSKIQKKRNEQSEFQERKRYQVRSLVLLAIFVIMLGSLLIKIAYIQFIKGSEYKLKAYSQQTTSQVLNSKRGTIYDSNNKILAISSLVDTVSINKGEVQYSNGDVVPDEVLAAGFAEIFSLDYEETLEKLNQDSKIITIAKRVDKELVDNLNNWMQENKITTGINIDEDSKRTYPYNNLASNIIGFYGNDQGLAGIEAEWDKELSGTPGRIVTSVNVNKEAISDENEQYVPAQNGSDLYLTIDANIQQIAEKYLNQAVIENKADGGCVIIMKPSTGDILAEASYPTYNLNTPFEPNTDELKAKWDTLSQEEQMNELNQMWRNKPIADGYEPGSTFKIITSAIGLEENIVETDTPGDFTCNLTMQVADRTISCWASTPHYSQSLRKALQNSCNPAFMQLGARIGKERFYKYLNAFGFMDRTGVRMAGESGSIFHDYESCNEVDLATMSFGQRFTITPLQLVTAVSACVNGGNLMQPRIVSKTVDTNSGIVTELEPKTVRQVISEETSEKIKSMLGDVVTYGTGKGAKVAGYEVGGKSGTSEPLDSKKSDGYVASFIAISPVENPEVVCLVAIFDPKAGRHQGGEVAAPVVAQILKEVLPHIGVISSNSSKDINEKLTMIPDVTGKTLTEARKTLEYAGFKVVLKAAANSDVTVVSQYPHAGVSLNSGSVVALYTQDSEKTMKTVPDLKGKTAEQAKNSLLSINLNISSSGNGVVSSQDIMAGTQVEEGTIINVTLSDKVSRRCSLK